MRSRLIATTCLVAVMAILPVTAQEIGDNDGQQEEPRQGTWATLRFDSGVEIDDNLNLNVNSPGVATTLTNDIAFQFGKSTQRDRLIFGLTGDLRYEARADEDNEFILLAPRASLSYSRFGLNSTLSLNGSIQRRNLERTEEFALDVDGDGVEDFFDFRFGSGFLTSSRLGVRYVHGLNAPIRLTFSANASDQSYDVTDDTIFDDNQTYNFGIDGEFRFNPVMTGLASVSTSQFVASDVLREDLVTTGDTERDTTRASVGLRYDYANIWTFEANAGVAKITTTTDPGGFEDVEDGTDLDFSAVRSLSYGSAFGEITRLTRVGGERTSLRFGGEFNLPDGAISASIGRTSLDGGDANWIFTAGYLKELRDGEITADLSRAVRSSSDQDQSDQLVTELSLAYLKRINNTQTLRVGFERDEIDGEPRSLVQSELSATYSYGLTRDWDLNVGYQHRRTNISAGRTASSNSVSLTLSREFDLF